MPAATTPYSTIEAYTQDAVQDDTTDFWDATAWLREVNRVTKDILKVIHYYRAYTLCDKLLTYVDITGDDSGNYDWHAAIATASKTYYRWTKVTVNEDEYDVARVSHVNWHNAKRNFIVTANEVGLWSIGTDGTMYTCPDFKSTDTIHFWFLQLDTAMTSDDSVPDIDETLIDMYELGFGIRYWRARGRMDNHAIFKKDWIDAVKELIRPYAATKIIRLKSTKAY